MGPAMTRRACLLLSILLATVGCGAYAADAPVPPAPLELRSPDGSIVVLVDASGPLGYRLTIDGRGSASA